MHFKLSNVFQWCKLNGFEELFDNHDYWLNIAYKPKEKISIDIDENTTIEFVPVMGAHDANMLLEKIDISQFVSIYIKKKNATIYSHFFDDLEKIINLVELVTNKKVDIRKIECLNYNKFHMIGDIKDYFKYEMMDYRMKDNNEESDNKIEIMDYLFDLPEIYSENKLKNWFNTYDKYRNIYNLYLLGIKNDIPIEIRFSNLIQVMELLHSIKFSRLKKFYKHIETKFINNLEIIEDIENNDDQKESCFILLRSRIIDMFINEFQLTIRANMITNIIPLSNILADSRNYYTHYNDSKRNKCVVKDNLRYCVLVLEYLVYCYILKELGFSVEYINEKKKYTLDYIIGENMIEKIIENKR